MSAKRRSRSDVAAKAVLFAALGDETRLLLLRKLARGQRYSIAQLTEGTKLTRQAVTKHLRVLERVRVIHARTVGRERLFEVDPKPIQDLATYLESVSQQWDMALGRLKDFVEKSAR